MQSTGGFLICSKVFCLCHSCATRMRDHGGHGAAEPESPGIAKRKGGSLPAQQQWDQQCVVQSAVCIATASQEDRCSQVLPGAATCQVTYCRWAVKPEQLCDMHTCCPLCLHVDSCPLQVGLHPQQCPLHTQHPPGGGAYGGRWPSLMGPGVWCKHTVPCAGRPST